MGVELPVCALDRQRRRRNPRAQWPPDPASRRQRSRHHAPGPSVGTSVKLFSALGERFREGLKRSQEYLARGLGAVLETDRPIDDTLLDEFEELLIAADLRVMIAVEFTHRAREEVMFGTVTGA